MTRSPAPWHVALLRGVNVGRAKRIAMGDLRALVEALGYPEARTLLNSGNVVFRLPAGARGPAAARIERGLAERLGISSRVVGLSAEELRRVVAENRLAVAGRDPSRLHVAVLFEPGDGKLVADIARRDWAPEALATGSRAVYLWCPEGLARSPLAETVSRALGDRHTVRNWATIGKLLALVGADDGVDPEAVRVAAKKR